MDLALVMSSSDLLTLVACRGDELLLRLFGSFFVDLEGEREINVKIVVGS